MTRRAWPVVLALAGVLAVPANAAAPVPPAADPATTRWLTVPVEGGGTVRLPYRGTPPRGVTATRKAPPAGPVTESSEDTAAPPTDHGPLPGHEAKQFPADAPEDAGTITSITGGRCDTYPAREATIQPSHLAYDRQGRLWFVDVATLSAGAHPFGSSLVRMVDLDGRVRTLGPVLTPLEGRGWRQTSPDTILVSLVPDDAGGVYLNVSPGAGSAGQRDVPRGSAIVHLHADGRRDLLVGGLPSPGATITPGYGDGDPVTRTGLRQVQGWTLDPAGNVYLADAFGDGFLGTRIRFANRSKEPVTFYPGTPYETTVQPGRIGTVAGTGFDTLDPNAGYLRAPTGPARTTNYYEVPRIVVREGVLYLITSRWGGWEAVDGAHPALLHAINLFSSSPVVVNGRTVDPGHSAVIAGNFARPAGYSGDGGPAVAAQFGFVVNEQIGDFYVARDGSLVIADTANHRIRRVDNLGLVTTIAGTGVPSFNGEGESALLSTLWQPVGIAEDRAGRPVFSDFGNARIRRIEQDGTLVTIAGRGPTPCGDGHLATGTTPLEGAYFGNVSDTAYDSRGRLYVADSAFKTIRRVGPGGRIEATIGQVARCAGYLWSVSSANLVESLRACPSFRTPSTDGPLSGLRLGGPHHIRVDSYDNLVVSDTDRLVYLNLRRKPVSVLGITVPALSAATLRTFGVRTIHVEIAVPGGVIPPLPEALPPLPVDPGTTLALDITFPLGDVALDTDGTAYVSDALANVVYRLSTCYEVSILTGTGHAPVYAGQGDGGPATAASLVPHTLDIDRANRLLYVVDAARMGMGASGSPFYGARVRAVNLDAKRAHEGFGTEVAPAGIETVMAGNRCSDAGDACAYGYGGHARDAAFGPLATIALARDGSMYVADTNTKRAGVVFPDGRYYGIAGPGAEKRDGQLWFGNDPTYPSGYHGDGGRALDAWFSWSWGSHSPDAALTLDPSGGLLLSDGPGRVRRIADVANTQLRTGSVVPSLPLAGAGYSELTIATGPAPTPGTRLGVARPDLVETPSGPVLVAAAGALRGCATWQVDRDADGRGHDAVTPTATGPVPAFPAGGTHCTAAGTAGGLALVTNVRPRDGTAGTEEAALLAATSTNAGDRWTPVPVAGTDRAGGAGLGAPALAADASAVAYRTASGGLGVAARSGPAYVAAATPVTGVVAVGDAVPAAGRLAVGYVSHGLRAAVVQVAVAPSPAGPWVSEVVWTGDAATTRSVVPPSLAADAAGTLYAAWSDGRAVYVARRPASGTWTEPVRLSALYGSTSPTVTAGRAGQVAVGFFATARPRSTAEDPYAFWYAATAVSRDGARTFDVRVASPTDVLRGALCEMECPLVDDAAEAQEAVAVCLLGGACTLADGVLGRAAAPGRVRVRLAPDGGVGLAFAVDAQLTGDGMAAGVAYQRSCTSVTGGRVSATCAGVRSAPPVRRPPNGSPGAPPVPTLPSPTGCSAAPPAYRDPPAPAREPAPAPGPDPAPADPPRPNPGLAVIPPLVPVHPAYPAANAPAATAQSNQAQQSQSGSETVANPVTGFAADEQSEQETVEEYAMSRRSDRPAAVAGAGAVLLAAAAAVAYERRRRAAAAWCH